MFLSLSLTGALLWKVEQRSLVALACSKAPHSRRHWFKASVLSLMFLSLSLTGVSLCAPVEGRTALLVALACSKASHSRRHWFKVLEQVVFVDLSEDSAWILKTNGDLLVQTALCQERPCARSLPVETPGVFVQVCASGGVVWALTEHSAVFYREGVSSLCAEGERWVQDTVSEAQGLEPLCLALGSGLVWALDSEGGLWFRTGISPSRPQGTDDHWWEVRIWDYAAPDQGSLFQSLWSGSGLGSSLGSGLGVRSGPARSGPVRSGPVDRVVSFLSQSTQVQPALVCSGPSGIWVGSARNRIHHSRSGRVTGTFWQTLVPRGTVSSTKWSFITSSCVHPPNTGCFLWLCQSRRDLFCVWDQDGELRPSSVPLPPEVELSHVSVCKDSVWALDSFGRVLIRTLTQACPSGLSWTLLDLSQLESREFVLKCVRGQRSLVSHEECVSEKVCVWCGSPVLCVGLEAYVWCVGLLCVYYMCVCCVSPGGVRLEAYVWRSTSGVFLLCVYYMCVYVVYLQEEYVWCESGVREAYVWCVYLLCVFICVYVVYLPGGEAYVWCGSGCVSRVCVLCVYVVYLQEVYVWCGSGGVTSGVGLEAYVWCGSGGVRLVWVWCVFLMCVYYVCMLCISRRRSLEAYVWCGSGVCFSLYVVYLQEVYVWCESGVREAYVWCGSPCGSQNVWAVDSKGLVYFRVGTQPLNPSMMLPAWICIEPL
ncbi:hypothetical protein WMY93_032893, partial [Mugilogobius chulae]